MQQDYLHRQDLSAMYIYMATARTSVPISSRVQSFIDKNGACDRKKSQEYKV